MSKETIEKTTKIEWKFDFCKAEATIKTVDNNLSGLSVNIRSTIGDEGENVIVANDINFIKNVYAALGRVIEATEPKIGAIVNCTRGLTLTSNSNQT